MPLTPAQIAVLLPPAVRLVRSALPQWLSRQSNAIGTVFDISISVHTHTTSRLRPPPIAPHMPLCSSRSPKKAEIATTSDYPASHTKLLPQPGSVSGKADGTLQLSPKEVGHANRQDSTAHAWRGVGQQESGARRRNDADARVLRRRVATTIESRL